MINAQQIADLLKRLDWKQVDLAKYCDVTQATVSRWLSGSLPDPPAQAKLQKLFNDTFAEHSSQGAVSSSELDLNAVLEAVHGSYLMIGLDRQTADEMLSIVLEVAQEQPTPSAGPNFHRVQAERAVRKFLLSKQLPHDGA